MRLFYFSDVEIAVTSDGNTIVCYHPTVDIPYELTQVCMLVCEGAEDTSVEILTINVCFVSCAIADCQAGCRQ